MTTKMNKMMVAYQNMIKAIADYEAAVAEAMVDESYEIKMEDLFTHNNVTIANDIETLDEAINIVSNEIKNRGWDVINVHREENGCFIEGGRKGVMAFAFFRIRA